MLVDIACNITSEQFKETDEVIERARKAKTIPIFVGVDYKSSLECVKLAEKYDTLCYVGLHPTHSSECFDDLDKLPSLLDGPTVVALGECGLDYCRIEYASKAIQKDAFLRQLDLRAPRYFLHSRDSHRDFMEVIGDYSLSGVVHSFTGTCEEASELIKKGLYIGINGCSLKTEEGIEMVKSLPKDKILLETDSPYCKIRKSYAGAKYVTYKQELKILRKRNEPCCLNEVLEAVSRIREVQENELKVNVLKNSVECFGEKLEQILQLWH